MENQGVDPKILPPFGTFRGKSLIAVSSELRNSSSSHGCNHVLVIPSIELDRRLVPFWLRLKHVRCLKYKQRQRK